ncbi:MAG: hypothetical protein ACLFVS_07290, partial [Candidatus Acetothermia bacterium]
TYTGIVIDIKLGATSGLKVLNNKIHGMAAEGTSDPEHSWGIHSYNTGSETGNTLDNIEIIGNEIYDIGKADVAQGFGIGLQELNSYSDNGDEYAAVIRGNSIHDIVDRNVNNPGVGVIIQPAVFNGDSAVESGAANALIECNEFTSNSADVAIGGEVAVDPASPLVQMNDFGSGGIGVAVDYIETDDASDPVVAEYNYWGDLAGPKAIDNSGGNGDEIVSFDGTIVSYRPWINGSPEAGIDSECSLNWDPNFQGNKTVHNVDDDEWFWTISGALDASNFDAGDTIEAHDGTYTNDLEAHDLIGPGYDSTTIQAASNPILELVGVEEVETVQTTSWIYSKDVNPIEVVDADDITMQGFLIENDPDYGAHDMESLLMPKVLVEDSENFNLIDSTIDGHSDQLGILEAIDGAEILNILAGEGGGFYLGATDGEQASATLKGVTVQRNLIGILVDNEGTGDADLTMEEGSWNYVRSNGFVGLMLGLPEELGTITGPSNPSNVVSGADVQNTKFIRNGWRLANEETALEFGGAVLATSGDNSVTNSVFENNAEGFQVGNINWNVTFLNTDSTQDLDATNNYWDSASGPYHATKNPSSDGQAVSDFVTFAPYWTAAPSDTGGTEVSHTFSPETGAGWMLVSYPNELANPTAAGVFDAPVFTTPYDESSGDYVERSGSDSVSSSVGYWLYLGGDRTVGVEGSEASSPVTLTFDSTGWQLISVPFQADWDEVDVLSGSFASDAGDLRLVDYVFGGSEYGYMDHYSDSSFLLSPWKGYWIKVESLDSGQAELELPKTTASGPPSSAVLSTTAAEVVPMSEAKDSGLDYPPAPPVAQNIDLDSLEVAPQANMGSGMDTVTFNVVSGNAFAVSELNVDVYSGSGELVFSDKADGSSLTWNVEGVANGIYLYKATAKAGGETVSTGIDKLLVLR